MCVLSINAGVAAWHHHFVGVKNVEDRHRQIAVRHRFRLARPVPDS